ncbi:MAG: CCA tRNA nucleotidyltransferase, partial [Rhodothermales bacterium]
MSAEVHHRQSLAGDIDRHGYGPLLRKIGRIARREGIEAYAVGGVVRDLLLERDTTDIDFVTVGHGTGIRLAEEVAKELGGEPVHVYPNFGTAAIRLGNGIVLEFVGARRESYRSHSRKPIVEEGSLDDDLRRRDFTVNAMAAALEPDRFGDLVDPLNGLKDMEDRLLRTPLEPEETFKDDPLRMIRAARFSAQLHFDIEESTFDAMREQSERVEILSMERITDELQKMICTPVPSIGFKVLFAAYILQRFFPELSDLQGVEDVDGLRHKDNFYHTLQVLDNLV